MAQTPMEAISLITYYALRGSDDLGLGEVERLLEAAKLLAYHHQDAPGAITEPCVETAISDPSA